MSKPRKTPLIDNWKSKVLLAAVVASAASLPLLPLLAEDLTVSEDLTLTADRTIDGKIVITPGATVDLNGYTLTASGIMAPYDSVVVDDLTEPDPGTNCSVRVYTNVLSEAQFALNRRIDEMRFFGNGDVVVVNAQTIEGATAMSSLPDGEYNIESGGWTFTARDITANREFYRPVLSVEMLVDGEWVQMSQEQTYSYSVTVPISRRIRLTWSWKRHVGLTVFVR